MTFITKSKLIPKMLSNIKLLYGSHCKQPQLFRPLWVTGPHLLTASAPLQPGKPTGSNWGPGTKTMVLLGLQLAPSSGPPSLAGKEHSLRQSHHSQLTLFHLASNTTDFYLCYIENWLSHQLTLSKVYAVLVIPLRVFTLESYGYTIKLAKDKRTFYF